MGSRRLVGVILLVAGVALLVVGLNASHSVSDQISNTFTGKFTQTTTWYIVGGAGAAVLGLLLTLTGKRG